MNERAELLKLLKLYPKVAEEIYSELTSELTPAEKMKVFELFISLIGERAVALGLPTWEKLSDEQRLRLSIWLWERLADGVVDPSVLDIEKISSEITREYLKMGIQPLRDRLAKIAPTQPSAGSPDPSPAPASSAAGDDQVMAAGGGAGGGSDAIADDRFGLTPREVEVANLLAKGLTRKEIGADLVVSVTTIGTHAKSIGQKLKGAGIDFKQGQLGRKLSELGYGSTT